MGTQTIKTGNLSAKRAALLAQLLDAEQPEVEQNRSIPPRANPREYPLSPGQQRMWLLGQFEEGTHYNEDCNFRLKGTVDVPVLEKTLREIFRRHEAMRAIFALEEGKVVQRLVPVEALELPVIDISGTSESDRETVATQIAVEEARAPFDLARGPLWRFTLLVLDEQNSILLTAAHHVAVDGWSRDIFRQEFFTLYEAFLAGKPSPLPEPAIQYSDYGAWLTSWLEGVEANQQRAYWTKELTGAPQLLELPADRPRQANQSFRGGRYYCTIPKQLITPLKTVSNREGVTFFMTLLALFNTLIKRYTEKDDIVVGSPVANRSHPEIEGLIGFFVNTIALRTDLSGDPTFRELLQRVRQTTIAGVSNQELPFDQLVELLHPERTEAYSPLVQVLLVFRNPSGMTAELPGLSVSEFKIDNGTSKFDLSLYLAEGPEGLSCMYEYSTDLFNADRIERMAGHLQVLMESVALDPGKRLSELSILTAEEQRELLVDWNETSANYPRGLALAQLVEAQAKRTPDATSAVYGKQKLTYRELNARANQLARKLSSLGAGPDKVVGLYVERSTDLVVALLAIVKTGAAYLPLDPLFPADRLSYMLEDSGAQLLVTEQKLRNTLPNYSGAAVLLEEKDWQSNRTENLTVAVTPENLAYLIYTSGSTGKPKGVQVPRGALTNFLWSMREWLELSERDRLLAVTTISFDIAGLEIWLPLLVGAQIVVASHEAAADGSALRGLIELHDITFLQATPVTWRLLFEAGWKGKRDLQAVCGGEAMPPEVATQLVPAVKRVWNLYGPTETTIWSTGYLVTDATRPILIGRPLANTQCYILDAQRNPVPVGVTGELYIGGDGLARGYLNRPELTAEKFVADPFRAGEARMYRTGDLARYRADGNIECLGRVDHQVKLRGYRIELGEIEALLKAKPEIKQAVVIVREDTPGDKRLVAYYATGLEGGSAKEAMRTEDLRSHLSASLPEYMVPAAFVLLETFPLTPNGKLDRKALPAPEAEAFSTRAYEPPQGELETKLAVIWAEMLNVDRIGRHDNFFDLGGHSLLAVRLMVRLQKIIPGEILPVRSILEAPTIERFAVWLGNQKDTEQQVLVQLRQGNPAQAPFFCAHASNGIAIGIKRARRNGQVTIDRNASVQCIGRSRRVDGQIIIRR